MTTVDLKKPKWTANTFPELTVAVAAPKWRELYLTPPVRKRGLPKATRNKVSVSALANHLGIPSSLVTSGVHTDAVVGLETHRGTTSFTLEEAQLVKKTPTKKLIIAAAQRTSLNGNDAAQLLGLTRAQFDRLHNQGHIPATGAGEFKWGTYLTWRTQEVLAFRPKLPKVLSSEDAAHAWDNLCALQDAVVNKTAMPQLMSRRTVVATKNKTAKQSLVKKQVEQTLEQVSFLARGRAHQTSEVYLHLGPTNSGKTYDALAALAKEGQGVYAAPLRMLAQEAYDRLAELLGENQVGLLTGEESINSEAPVLCCTAEMAPTKGKLLVLDEAHWLTDKERGYAWTTLLAAADFETFHIIAMAEAEPLLMKAFKGHDIQVTKHQRKSHLTYQKAKTIGQVADKTLVVAFSKKAVHMIARDLEKAGKTVGTLYGALPPSVRRNQIKNFVDGKTQVLVCTDVIGHGVNIPANTVLVAQTEKYDGTRHRDLYAWEMAQIVGRAGRGTNNGYAGVLRVPGITAKPELVAHAVRVANGTKPSGLSITHGTLRPRATELGWPDAHTLPAALLHWQQVAAKELKGHTWLKPMDVAAMWQRGSIVENLAAKRHKYTPEQTWQLCVLPVDPGKETFRAIAGAVAGKCDLTDYLHLWMDCLEEAEEASAIAQDLMVATGVFGNIGGITYQQAQALEQQAAQAIEKHLAAEISNSHIGICYACGDRCAPWFNKCDSCHQDRWKYWED